MVKNQILRIQSNVNPRKISIIFNDWLERSVGDACFLRRIGPGRPSHRILFFHSPDSSPWLSYADTKIRKEACTSYWLIPREKKGMWPVTTFLPFPRSKSVEVQHVPISCTERLSTVSMFLYRASQEDLPTSLKSHPTFPFLEKNSANLLSPASSWDFQK